MSRYGKILFSITSLDLISTLIMLNLHIIREANPIWNWVVNNHGLMLFALYRTILVMLALAIIEYAYRRYEIIRKRCYYQIAIWSYVGLYFIGVAIAQ